MIYLILISLILAFIISISSWFLTAKSSNEEKLACYECGFESNLLPYLPFSVKFYLVGVLFLVFDVEVALLFPYVIAKNGYIILTVFVLLLGLGLFYELYKGGNDWIN